VVRAARLWQVHNMRELIVDGTIGSSNGGSAPTGTRDYAVESWLYSSPLAYQYRAFAHLYDAQAKFDNGIGRRERAGVGLEYRSPLVTATGELSHGLNESETGVSGSLALTPNDYWTFRGKLDSSENDIPLQARLFGINAWSAQGEVIWRAHESRNAGVLFAYQGFSDGNNRDITQAHWTERVIAGPVYKLEVTAGLYASRNSLAGAPYFNPSRDFSPTLEFDNEWLQWRRYTRAFRHRLAVTVGDYWQQGFGTRPVTNLRYEQEWTADDRLTFRYGVGRSLHPYDGVQTTHYYGYFHVDWRF
jgi:biofilm PGA synthesis protein PgaA